MLAHRIKQQVTLLDRLQLGIDRDTIKLEVGRLDQAVQELADVTLRMLDMIGDSREGMLLQQTLEEFETLAVTSKQGAYALVSRSNSGSSGGGSLRGSKQDVQWWLTQSGEGSVLPQVSDVQLDNSSYPEMLQVNDNLRGTLNQKVTRLEDLLIKGDSDKLVQELENLELLHQQLVHDTNNIVGLLPNELTERFEMAKLDALESKVCGIKEEVYSYLAAKKLQNRTG